MSDYYGRRIKNALSAAAFMAGSKTLLSDGGLKITVAVPDGFSIKASVVEGSVINIAIIKREAKEE